MRPDPLIALSGEQRALYSIDTLQTNLQHGVLDIPASTFDGTNIHRLTGLRSLPPINNLDELIDMCARVVEDGSLVDEAEQCIDGLARLCASPKSDIERMSAPIRKRVRQLLRKGASPFCGMDPSNDVMGLIYAFVERQVIEPRYAEKEISFEFEGEKRTEYCVNMRKPIGFLSRRCLAIAHRIAEGTACQLLSTPTHEQGWIDPLVLPNRILSWRESEPDDPDVILAMLRLAPENRSQALQDVSGGKLEWVNAIRYALGASKVTLGNKPAIWIAAARASSPRETDERVAKKFPELGPDAAEAAQVAFRTSQRKSHGYTSTDVFVDTKPKCPKKDDPLLVTVLFHSSRSIGNALSFEAGGFGGRTTGANRWTATIWPIARDSFFASAGQDGFENLDWHEAQWQNRTMLEPLLDSGTPLRTIGLHFLVGMLSAKEPGESGLATDIAIRAIQDGRLGSDNLGAAMFELLQTGLIKPGRWQKTLADIARTSPVHAAVIQLALQQCLDERAKVVPKDTAKLLELMSALSVELGLPADLPAFRGWLKKNASSGKAAKLAKDLVTLESTPDRIRQTTEILSS